MRGDKTFWSILYFALFFSAGMTLFHLIIEPRKVLTFDLDQYDKIIEFFEKREYIVREKADRILLENTHIGIVTMRCENDKIILVGSGKILKNVHLEDEVEL